MKWATITCISAMWNRFMGMIVKKHCSLGTAIPKFVRRNKRRTQMDFLQLAAGRYSIRSFSGRPLTEMTNKL